MKVNREIIALVFIFISFSCIRASDYPLAQVKSTGYGEGLSLTGHVIPQNGALSIESASFQGRVISILKKEGEMVSAGTPILLVSSSEGTSMMQELEMAKKKNSIELINAINERLKRLGIIIDGEDIKIVASRSGIITKRYVEMGSIFNMGDPLVNILKPSLLSVEFDVPEYEMSKINVGQDVRITLASDSSKTYRSTIETIIPTIDPATRTIKIRLYPVHLPGSTALDTLVYGKIDVRSAVKLLSVPTTALVFSHNNQYVIKKSGNDYKIVPVEIVNEEEKASTIKTIEYGVLQSGDIVIGSNAIYLFQKLSSKE